MSNISSTTTEPSYPPVLTKADFVRRYKRGEFGNASPTWHTPHEFIESNYSGLVHLRNRVVGGTTHYNLAPSKVIVLWNAQMYPELWYASGMAPHHCNVIQGEVQVMPSIGGITLMYSTVPGLPMREALAQETQYARGIIALCHLQRFLCPSSYQWLHTLLARYPGHVVEFSTFSRNWGTLPHYNTVFWEVRNY
jgi:hypothetical protein